MSYHYESFIAFSRLAGHIGSKLVLLPTVVATLAHRSNGELMNNLLDARTLKLLKLHTQLTVG